MSVLHVTMGLLAVLVVIGCCVGPHKEGVLQELAITKPCLQVSRWCSEFSAESDREPNTATYLTHIGSIPPKEAAQDGKNDIDRLMLQELAQRVLDLGWVADHTKAMDLDLNKAGRGAKDDGVMDQIIYL